MRTLCLSIFAASMLLPVSAMAEDADMTAYVGKHPTAEVNGVSFIAHPAVIEIVERAIEDEALRRMVLEQTKARSFATNVFQSGEHIYFYAYDPTHGSADNWGVSVSADGAEGAVCVAVGGSEEAPPEGKWYLDGSLISVSVDGCPSEETGLKMAFGS